ncbi:restriction endonuclease [Neobacillus dielmonensis]|uniref:restriction endonuclease n=1 Tax=Neobacillus dielmonensis TaxID=1347369 RepID=UPI000693A6D8|nr:restriction endonuclease [Neobacillus dielmonensis]
MNSSVNDEVEQQYQADLLLDKIIIKDIYYNDEEENAFVPATLTLFGHCYEIETYTRQSSVWKRITHKSNGKGEEEFTITPSSMYKGEVEVCMNQDTTFLMVPEKAETVKQHVDSLNQKFTDERIKFKSEMELKATQILLYNQEINSLLTNFIESVDPFTFFQADMIIGVEYKLYSKNRIGKMLLLSTDTMRRSLLMHDEFETKGGKDGAVQTTTYEKLNNQEQVDRYFENHFDLLVKLINKKLQLNDLTHTYYLTYVLLYKKVIEYFSLKWAQDYGEYFTNIEEQSLEEAVVTYCCIDTIDPELVRHASPFVYYLMHHRKFEDLDNYLDCTDLFVEVLNEALENKKLLDFERNLMRNQQKMKVTINDVDLMSGHEFENFVGVLFAKMGYTTTVTKGSGDQGIDVIVEKNGKRFGVQAKCYSSAVNNKAVQEVVAGLSYYQLEKGIVITNNYFTDSARDLAYSNDVILWDRNYIKEKLSELF